MAAVRGGTNTKRRSTSTGPGRAVGLPLEAAFARYFHITTNAPGVEPPESWALKCRGCGLVQYLTPSQLASITHVLDALNSAHEAHQHTAGR